MTFFFHEKGSIFTKTVSVLVQYIPGRFQGGDKLEGSTAYFRVMIDPVGRGYSGSGALSPSILNRWSNEQMTAVLKDLEAQKTSSQVLQLGQSIAAASFCAHGTLSMDPRTTMKPAPFTPEQQARITAALGGNNNRLLNMSQSDLRRLGLGFVIDRPKVKVPAFRYETSKSSGRSFAEIRMRCIF